MLQACPDAVGVRLLESCPCRDFQARSLQAVPRLVKLFNHANQKVQCHATGAMCNLIYDNADNKLALVEENGIFELLRTLREQDDELRENVTALCWLFLRGLRSCLFPGALATLFCGCVSLELPPPPARSHPNRPVPTSLSRGLCDLKQPTISPGGAPAMSLRLLPSSRCSAEGDISSYRRHQGREPPDREAAGHCGPDSEKSFWAASRLLANLWQYNKLYRDFRAEDFLGP
ncbi:Plakophilin-3 [Plecturocebus cupreus]